jgi:hypothetical protein
MFNGCMALVSALNASIETQFKTEILGNINADNSYHMDNETDYFHLVIASEATQDQERNPDIVNNIILAKADKLDLS